LSQDGEHQLLSDAQDGDELAFAELQARLEPGIRRFVRRLVGAVPDAEDDIMQDVFIALYKNIERIEPAAKLRPYVYRIARNRCYDELRKMGRYESFSLDDEPATHWVSYNYTISDDPAPDEAVHWIMLYMEVQDAINKLPEMQRQTLILYSEEHLSYAEIADVMHTTIGTVKSRLYHARRALPQLLRPATRDILANEFDI